MTYQEFLKSKVRMVERVGFDVSDDEINPNLKPHQRAAVKWLVNGGRRALFAAFGLGKSVTQIETVRLMLSKIAETADLEHPTRGLITCPLGFRGQEGKSFAAQGGQTFGRVVRPENRSSRRRKRFAPAGEIRFTRSREKSGEAGGGEAGRAGRRQM